jgi:hypothetical protein
MSAQTHYEEKLACPVTPGQGCHSWMMSTCNLGALANLSPDEIFMDIRRVVHPSRPDKEINETIKEALRSHGDGNHRGFTAPTRRDVKAVIHDGAAVFNKIVSESKLSTERELIIASPVAIPESPRDQQRLFFETVFQSDDFVFCGDRLQSGNDKTILPACECALNGASGPFVIVNPFSGMPAPKKSGDGLTYRGDACVKTFRHCLIEFDDKSIEDQIKFWSVIKLPVRALIHTGNKSIHAWLDLANESIGNLDAWEKTIKIDLYEKRLKPLGVDMACSNPSRLSRLPGVFRAEKNQWQRLLWLSKEGCHVR